MDDNRVYFDIPKLKTTISFDLDERYKSVNDMTKEEKKDVIDKVTLIMESAAIMISKEEYERITENYKDKSTISVNQF